MPAFRHITIEQWQRLTAKRLFFGHQSVGENVIVGIEEILRDNPQISLKVADAALLEIDGSTGLFHSKVGVNRDPSSKTAEFENVANSAAPQVAMLKYCYVDVNGESDARQLFSDYQNRMAKLRSRNRELVIVHFTMPLTDLGGRRDSLVAKLRRQATKRDLNFIRHEYNTLIRQEYTAKEPIFDIARLESTLADGSRTLFRTRGRDIPFLAPAYTDDGGHLNAFGRKHVAEHLLAMLATL